MRRHARASSARSKARKPVGPESAASSGRLYIAVLAATVAAFFVVPVAQAAAAPTFKQNITGTGSGEVSSVGGAGAYPGFEEFGPVWQGEPPIECEYASPGPATGVCKEVEIFTEEGSDALALRAIPAPGSEFAGWKLGAGLTNEAFPEGGIDCSSTPQCLAIVAEGPEREATAVFCTTGTAEGWGEGCVLPLTVAKEGTGSGTVVSSPAGLECGGTCTASFKENTKVTLTASPSAGSTFVSWKGCEKGGVNGRQCTVTMDKAKTVNAKFLTAYDVTVNRVGSGLGKVSSSPGGVLCLSNCSSTTAAFKEGTSVTLTAAPTKNYVFTEWTGDCSGSSLTCSLGSLGADKTVGAKFTAVAQHNLTVTKSGGGNGTAKSNVAGINCGATCSSMAAAYFQGTVVELTATPGKGSAFGGWSGSGCSGTGTCTVTMSAAKSVTAEFK